MWIPQVTLAGRREDLDLYDLGAFTTEAEATKAMEQWLEDERTRGGRASETAINIVAVYDTADEWAANR